MDNNQTKEIEMTARFTNFEVINSEFTRARVNVFYTGRNRNGSDITQEALDKFIARKGYANVPVVAHLMKDDDGHYHVGGHDRKLVMDEKSMEIIDETVPFGVIPEDCNPAMETITERSGEKRDYFSVDIILWTHRYPIMEAAYSDEIYFNQSMEINFTEAHYDNDWYIVVDDFTMSALCLLNRSMDSDENVEPCFESSMVTKFDNEEFRKNFDLMLEKYKQCTTGKDEPDNGAQNSQNSQTKGDKAVMELSRFAEVLSTVKIGETENAKYSLINATEDKVFALDMEDYKPYGFDYAVTTENGIETVVIDFNSKVEMSLTATDKIEDESFTGFDFNEIIESQLEERVTERTALLQAEFDNKVNELETSIESLSNDYRAATDELNEYRQKDSLAKAQAHKEEIDALFNKYAEKLGKCAEFLVYKAKVNPAECTTEEVEQHLTLMLGKYMLDDKGKNNFSYKPTENGVSKNNGKKAVNERYGDLLDKYMN